MMHEYENTLRRLIIEVIGGEDTSPYKVTEYRIAKWKEKRDIESKSNRNILTEHRLLYYSDFYDLDKIIDKNWELFSPILKEKKRFEVFFSEVESFRNTVAHGRNLTSGQENLLSGITSDLKNLITIYHNKNEMKDDFFIRIIKLSDNLGNDLMNSKFPYPILRVGDEYEIIVEANDPKGRKIEYELYNSKGLSIKQDSNRFKFTVNKKLVGEYSSISVYVRTPGSDYTNEKLISLPYTILPEKD